MCTIDILKRRLSYRTTRHTFRRPQPQIQTKSLEMPPPQRNGYWASHYRIPCAQPTHQCTTRRVQFVAQRKRSETDTRIRRIVVVGPVAHRFPWERRESSDAYSL